MTIPGEGEESAVHRLTVGIGAPQHNEILRRCLEGSITPAAALSQLLGATGDPVRVRSMIDEVTKRAASLSRATDSLLRDRVDDLTQLVVEDEP